MSTPFRSASTVLTLAASLALPSDCPVCCATLPTSCFRLRASSGLHPASSATATRLPKTVTLDLMRTFTCPSVYPYGRRQAPFHEGRRNRPLDGGRAERGLAFGPEARDEFGGGRKVVDGGATGSGVERHIEKAAGHALARRGVLIAVDRLA